MENSKDEMFAAVIDLKKAVDGGFARVEGRLDRVETRLDRVETRLTSIEGEVAGIKRWTVTADLRFDRLENERKRRRPNP